MGTYNVSKYKIYVRNEMFLFITWMFVQFEYFKYYDKNLDYIYFV